MRWRLILIVGALGVLAVSARAADDPCAQPLRLLTEEIAALGSPAAGEVRSERREVADLLVAMRKRADSVRQERDATDAEYAKLRRIARERDDKTRLLDFEQKVHDTEHEQWLKDIAALRADHAAFLVAKSVAQTEAQVAAVNAWSERGIARRTQLEQEEKRLVGVQTSIDQRRSALLSDIVGEASRAGWLGKRRSRVDRETVSILAEIAALRSRVLALSQVAGAPARATTYRPASEIADKAVADLLKGIAKEGALIGLEGKTMVRVLSKVGLRAAPVGAAFTVADTFADVALVGTDHRIDQLERDLLLIGDYGAVMKRMIAARGGAATQDPAYVAMRAEIDRLASELPGSEGAILVQGLKNAAALGEALRAALAQYTAGKVGKAAAGVTKKLDAASRAVHGPAGLQFFDRALTAVGKAGTEETTKSAAKLAAEQVRLSLEPEETR